MRAPALRGGESKGIAGEVRGCMSRGTACSAKLYLFHVHADINAING